MWSMVVLAFLHELRICLIAHWWYTVDSSYTGVTALVPFRDDCVHVLCIYSVVNVANKCCNNDKCTFSSGIG
jgi:hypothetical protein